VRGRHVFLALAALSLSVFAAGPQPLVLLAYHRASILRGELWRLLTGHFVHANGAHLLWNLGATALVSLAVARALSARSWLVAALAVALGCSAAVLLLQPQVRVMTGLSGLLHGLLAAGAAADIRRGERMGWVFLGVLAAKVGWEQLAGPSALTRSALGGEIAVGAHAFGALTGLVAGLVLPVPTRPATLPAPTAASAP
jgi:rhomboid family GlyGly-CTERM serine protease